jgi:hypothetical protein
LSQAAERLKSKTNKIKITLPVQSWAPRVEKVSDNRHGQITANTRLVTSGSQEPATPIRQRHPMTQHSALDNCYPTTNQKKLLPTTNPNRINNRQQIGVKRIEPIR